MFVFFNINCELLYFHFHIMQLIWKCLDVLHPRIYLEFCIWWRIQVIFQSQQWAFWCRTCHCRLSYCQCWIIWWLDVFFSGSSRWFFMLDIFFFFLLFGLLKQLFLPLDVVFLIQNWSIFWIVTLAIWSFFEKLFILNYVLLNNSGSFRLRDVAGFHFLCYIMD